MSNFTEDELNELAELFDNYEVYYNKYYHVKLNALPAEIMNELMNIIVRTNNIELFEL